MDENIVFVVESSFKSDSLRRKVILYRSYLSEALSPTSGKLQSSIIVVASDIRRPDGLVVVIRQAKDGEYVVETP